MCTRALQKLRVGYRSWSASASMPLVAPPGLSGLAKTRWFRGKTQLSGGAALNKLSEGTHGAAKATIWRLHNDATPTRLIVDHKGKVLKQKRHEAPPSSTWTHRKGRVPVVVNLSALNLESESPPRSVVAALCWLADKPDPVHVLLLNGLASFDRSCLEALLKLLERKSIFILNLGEAGALKSADYDMLLEWLRKDWGARLISVYLDDTLCPKKKRNAAIEAVGKSRREVTEAQARLLLKEGKLEQARLLVPWRDPAVHQAVNTCAQVDTAARWGHATWRPKTHWEELGL